MQKETVATCDKREEAESLVYLSQENSYLW